MESNLPEAINRRQPRRVMLEEMPERRYQRMYLSLFIAEHTDSLIDTLASRTYSQ
jgi:hypothetical protein